MESDYYKTLFELKNILSNTYENSDRYRYYSELFEKRKSLLNVLSHGFPYFEEIKNKTKNIQEVLKKSGYKNVEGLLRSLFINGIEFFLNLNYKIDVEDDIDFDDYFLGLFLSLNIDVNDKVFLKEILSELKSFGEDILPSPLDFLVSYQYEGGGTNGKNLDNSSNENGGNVLLEKQNTTRKETKLDTLLKEFHDKDYGFIKDLREVGVPEERLDYTFLVGLYDDICNLLDGKNVSQDVIDNIFSYYNIDISNKILLRSLKDEIEKSQILQRSNFGNPNFQKYQREIEKTEGLLHEVAKKKQKLMNKNNRLKGKKILRGHSAYDDTPEGVKLHGENLIFYNVGDEYIPCDNHASTIELVNKVNNSDITTLEKMYENSAFRKLLLKDNYDEYVKHIKKMLLIEFNDITKMYDDGDRFEVVRATYEGKEITCMDKEIDCRYVDVRSKKTGQVYRVLSH